MKTSAFTATTAPRTSSGAGPLLAYFGLAYGVSWVLWLPLYWAPLAHWRLPYHHAIGAFGPLLAGVVMTRWFEGKAGLRALLQALCHWRVSWAWYLLAGAGPYVLGLLAMAVAALIQNQPVRLTGFGSSSEFPEFSPVGFLLYNIFTFGIGEEAGWRGFALPRLEARFGARWTVLVLTFGWALWHLPLFFYRPGYVQMDAAGVMGWIASLLTGCALLAWLYRSTGGNLLLCALFHATIDVAFTSRGMTPQASGLLGALITVAGLVAWWRLPTRETPAAPTLLSIA